MRGKRAIAIRIIHFWSFREFQTISCHLRFMPAEVNKIKLKLLRFAKAGGMMEKQNEDENIVQVEFEITVFSITSFHVFSKFTMFWKENLTKPVYVNSKRKLFIFIHFSRSKCWLFKSFVLMILIWSSSGNVPSLLDLIYSLFTRMPGDSYCRRFRPPFLCPL